MVACRPALDGERILPALAAPVPYAGEKPSALSRATGGRGILASFGDNVFDIELLRAARLAVAVRPKPGLRARLHDLERNRRARIDANLRSRDAGLRIEPSCITGSLATMAMPRFRSFRPALLSLFLPVFAFACGGEENARRRPKLVEQEPVQETDHLHGVRTESEIGGLNEDAVEATFKRSLAALQNCLNDGSSRVEFLGGSVAFFLKIDARGRVEHAHLESSTLGDRTTERCMLRRCAERAGRSQSVEQSGSRASPSSSTRRTTCAAH